MRNKNSIRVVGWCRIVEIIAEGPTIYLKGYTIKEVKNMICKHLELLEDVKCDAMIVLDIAQECNASLQEIRSYPIDGVMRFYFDFKSEETSLEFESKLEKLSQ